jgi:serine/threonine-protein kinase
MDSTEVGHILLGRFVVEERLGRGGTGVVWRVRDLQTDERFALKSLQHRGDEGSELVERFAREAEVLLRLAHPGIARMRGFHRDGPRLWIVLELAEGETLDRLLGRRVLAAQPLDGAELRAILGPLVDAVGHAHAQGVVHRDLKPMNVMIGDGLRPRLLDFGLAKLLDDPETRDATTQGRRLGSTFYMPPEQVRGDPVDARADVFSLAAVAYELFTLRRAWAVQPDGAPAAAFDQPLRTTRLNHPVAVWERIARGPRPSVTRFRVGSAAAVDAVFAAALAPERDDRPATVRVFYDALAAAMGWPALAAPVAVAMDSSSSTRALPPEAPLALTIQGDEGDARRRLPRGPTTRAELTDPDGSPAGGTWPGEELRTAVTTFAPTPAPTGPLARDSTAIEHTPPLDHTASLGPEPSPAAEPTLPSGGSSAYAPLSRRSTRESAALASLPAVPTLTPSGGRTRLEWLMMGLMLSAATATAGLGVWILGTRKGEGKAVARAVDTSPAGGDAGLAGVVEPTATVEPTAGPKLTATVEPTASPEPTPGAGPAPSASSGPGDDADRGATGPAAEVDPGRRARPSAPRVREPVTAGAARSRPYAERWALLAEAQRSGSPASISRLGEGIEARAADVSDPAARARIRRIAYASTLVGDLDGLAEALELLGREGPR